MNGDSQHLQKSTDYYCSLTNNSMVPTHGSTQLLDSIGKRATLPNFSCTLKYQVFGLHVQQYALVKPAPVSLTLL